MGLLRTRLWGVYGEEGSDSLDVRELVNAHSPPKNPFTGLLPSFWLVSRGLSNSKFSFGCSVFEFGSCDALLNFLRPVSVLGESAMIGEPNDQKYQEF
jgi:hypothetical protein